MRRTDVSYEDWLDGTFGCAVSGQSSPQFVERDDWPDPVSDQLAVEYMTRLFENSEESLRYYSDRQITAGLWELGSGDAYCVYSSEVPIELRLRLVRSVETFFREFFANRCLPELSAGASEQASLLNIICYMWWEVFTWGWAKDEPDAERLAAQDLDVLEAVLRLTNPACKEAAIHGLGHLADQSDQALSIIDRFITKDFGISPELLQYARAARTGCIQ